tara:strand:+ start:577 stop:1791 length:1215 start_codon:yes stop_codon:yes gene_type:complete
MLITDVHSVSHLQVIEEGSAKNNHCPKVRGLFQRADEANQNKRVYPKTILENQVRKLQPLIKERRLCGELDHPQNDTVKLTNASHLVTKLWMEGNEVMGEAEILNTPNGKVAQALITDGVKIGISSRGLGTLSEDHMTGQKTVNEDYNLVTFDLVADPSTRGAHPAISESRILEEARYERTLKEAVSERVFVTMLKNKLDEGKKKPGKHPGQRELNFPSDDFWHSQDFANLGKPAGGPSKPLTAAQKKKLRAEWEKKHQQQTAAGTSHPSDPYHDPVEAEEAARRRAAQDAARRNKGKTKREDSSRDYFINRTLQRLEEKRLKGRVRAMVEASSGRKGKSRAELARDRVNWEENEKIIARGKALDAEDAKREGTYDPTLASQGASRNRARPMPLPKPKSPQRGY